MTTSIMVRVSRGLREALDGRHLNDLSAEERHDAAVMCVAFAADLDMNVLRRVAAQALPDTGDDEHEPHRGVESVEAEQHGR